MFKSYAGLISVVLFLLACSGRPDKSLPTGHLPTGNPTVPQGPDPQGPDPRGPDPQGPKPQPDSHALHRAMYCFSGVTLRIQTTDSQHVLGTKPLMTVEEFNKFCALAESQFKNSRDRAIQELKDDTVWNELKLQRLMNTVAWEWDEAIKILPISETYKENLRIKVLPEVERHIYHLAKQAIKEQFLASQKALTDSTEALTHTVKKSISLTKHTSFPLVGSPKELDQLSQENVSDWVRPLLEQKYDRRDLAILEDKGFGAPREELYEFKSSKEKLALLAEPDLLEEFLQKNRELYAKLRLANPYHEQGIRGRNCGLSAVEVADEAYAEGRSAQAELAYNIGKKMEIIALGALPLEVEFTKLYAFCTGKDLFTGAVQSLTSKELLTSVFVEGVSSENKELMDFISSEEGVAILHQIRVKALEKPVPNVLNTDLVDKNRGKNGNFHELRGGL